MDIGLYFPLQGPFLWLYLCLILFELRSTPVYILYVLKKKKKIIEEKNGHKKLTFETL